jgi:hypothetical protein
MWFDAKDRKQTGQQATALASPARTVHKPLSYQIRITNWNGRTLSMKSQMGENYLRGVISNLRTRATLAAGDDVDAKALQDRADKLELVAAGLNEDGSTPGLKLLRE